MNGIYPTPESIQAQGILVCIYAMGFIYMLLISPKQDKVKSIEENSNSNR
jgi:hypothetical protein